MSRFISEQYVLPITGVIQSPRSFFASMHKVEAKSMIVFLGIVIVSSAISALAKTWVSTKINTIMVFVVFANNIGMVFISSGLGYLFAKIVTRQSVRVTSVFNIYAISFAVTYLFSWIPYSLWITEPWKWWLIGTGFIHGAGIEFRRTLVIILLSISVMVGLLWTFLKLT